MDQLSTEAVTTFVNEVEGLRKANVCANIRHIGIVGTMLPSGRTVYFRPAVNNLRDEIRVKSLPSPLLDESTWISDNPAIGRAAGLTIGVLQGDPADRRKIREELAPLVAEIERNAPLRPNR